MWKKTFLISGAPWVPFLISGLIVFISGDHLSENNPFGLIGGVVVLLSAFFYLPGDKAISILLGVPQYKEKGLEEMVQGAVVYSLIAFIVCYLMMKSKKDSERARNSNLGDPRN